MFHVEHYRAPGRTGKKNRLELERRTPIIDNPCQKGKGGFPVAETVRAQVFYSGGVQGVGFRYTTQRIAASYAVAGFVENLPDGRVKVVAEGQSAEVEVFLDDVASAMAGCVSGSDVSWRRPTGEFDGFRVRF